MLLYITGNQHKIETANKHLEPFDITVEGMKIDGIIEPQAESAAEISESKAKQAFEKVHRPLIVSDGSWMISALNGFPGPYMSFVNKWFTTQDFLNLMKDKENKEIVLRESVTYIDENQIKTFVADTKGLLLEEASGHATPLDQIMTFREDRKSAAQCNDENLVRIPQNELWNDVGKWLKENNIF